MNYVKPQPVRSVMQKEKFFGWRWQLPDLYADRYAPIWGALIPAWRANMQPHAWFLDDIELRDYRYTLDTVTSQCEKVSLERLYARTNGGFEWHEMRIRLFIDHYNQQLDRTACLSSV